MEVGSATSLFRTRDRSPGNGDTTTSDNTTNESTDTGGETTTASSSDPPAEPATSTTPESTASGPSASQAVADTAPLAPVAAASASTQTGDVVRAALEAAPRDREAEDIRSRELAEGARQAAVQSRILEDVATVAENAGGAAEPEAATATAPATPGQFSADVEIVRGIGFTTVPAAAVDVRT